MRKLSILLITLFSAATLFAQEAPLSFKETKHSFGKIPQNKPVTHVFSFTNTAGKPVVIEDASADCGCTTPEYPKGLIAKGANNTLKVTYNAAAMGTFTKRITVKVANNPEPIILTIEGEVVNGSNVQAAPAKS